MGTRWFSTQRGPGRARRSTAEGRLSDEPKAVLLHDAISSWRAWLTSGRRFGDGAQRLHGPALDQVLQAGIVAVMTVAAVAVLVTHHAPAGAVTHPHKARVAAAPSVKSPLGPVPRAAPVSVVAPTIRVAVANRVSSTVAVQSLMVKVQVPALPVSLPAPPPILASFLQSASGVLT